ncbi:MAG: DUF1844 domain-containing protein [Fimbriimonadaceae bacterium]|nr:DUF1844 domain-containing protein [Fimbriimonadaceae bacterium]QYK57138.1 MAG: DUF1844 domain-containing protein [Fimbriimonadaceae bacterium]
MEQPESERSPIAVPEVLVIVVDQLSSLAWQKLGLQPDPVTGRLAQDLVQARMAIDSVQALSTILTPVLEGEDRRQLENLNANLKLNFVEKSQGQP